MRRPITTLALVFALAAGTAIPSYAQSAQAKKPHRTYRVLYMVLGGVAGGSLGALWIHSYCPNGSDSPRTCIGPPVGFIAGGVLAGYVLGRKTTPATPSRSDHQNVAVVVAGQNGWSATPAGAPVRSGSRAAPSAPTWLFRTTGANTLQLPR